MNMRYVEEVCSDTVRAVGRGKSVLQMPKVSI